MKVFVTGITGQLGHDVMHELQKRGHQAIGVGSAQLDITDSRQVDKVLAQADPEVVIHCAAYTAVDAAEDHQEQCRLVNVTGTENVAKFCGRQKRKMIYISTDYVFNGQGEIPWKPEDPKAPLNVYGQSKYDGELAVQKYVDDYFIVRIAWVFGVNGKNFIKTMLQLAENHKELSVVNDQFGSPTYTYDLAKLLVDMAESDKYGVYHATNEGICTWHEFACEIFRQAGVDVQVSPVTSDQFPTKAKRPCNSRMDKSKLTENGFALLPAWQDALGRYLKEIGR